MYTSRPDRHGSTLSFLHMGGAIPLVFASTLVVCGLRMGHYNHLSRLVSELGAIGTTTRVMFSFGLVLCAVLSVFFVVGLCRVCSALELSAIPAAMILSFSVSIAGAGLFPLPLRMHLISGMPSVLLPFSPLLSLLLWRGSRQLTGLWQAASVSVLVMSVGFLAFFPGPWSAYVGLTQRVFHAGWAMWFFYLSYRFVAIQRSRDSERIQACAHGSPDRATT
jgi:hypothetical membrane protein